jgi:hypothetical protein
MNFIIISIILRENCSLPIPAAVIPCSRFTSHKSIVDLSLAGVCSVSGFQFRVRTVYSWLSYIESMSSAVLRKLDRYDLDLDSPRDRAIFGTGRRNAQRQGSQTLRCLERFFICITLFFVILGVSMIGLGWYALSTQVVKLAGNLITIAFMSIGATIFVTSLMGCMGAFCRNKQLLSVVFRGL